MRVSVSGFKIGMTDRMDLLSIFSIAPIDAVSITLFVPDLDAHSLLSTVCM